MKEEKMKVADLVIKIVEASDKAFETNPIPEQVKEELLILILPLILANPMSEKELRKEILHLISFGQQTQFLVQQAIILYLKKIMPNLREELLKTRTGNKEILTVEGKG